MIDHNAQTGDLRAMTAADLSTVLGWRNHPEIRRHMFTQQEIGIDEHQQWFERSNGDPRRHLLLFEDEGQARGFVSLTVCDSASGVADWGFYAAPGAPKGTGRALGRAALGHAFDCLALHKVCGKAIDDNQSSIAMHMALGFTQEGVLREQFRIGQRHHAVICFGLLEREWLSSTGD